MTRREEEQARAQLTDLAIIFFPRCLRAEIEQAVADLVARLTSAPADLVALDSAAGDT
jgi:hypothetical protein